MEAAATARAQRTKAWQPMRGAAVATTLLALSAAGACFVAPRAPAPPRTGSLTGAALLHSSPSQPFGRGGRTSSGAAVDDDVAERRGFFSRPASLSAVVTSCFTGLKRLATHRMRQPAKRNQSPMAEIAFVAVLYGTVRAALNGYVSATDGWRLREDLFAEMAVARTYKNSIGPWITSGVIALIFSIFVIIGVKSFIKSMKEWEARKEIEEMNAMGSEDALFLMSTPVDATPLEKKKEKMRKRLTPLPQRIMGGFMDKLWMFRVGACIGYLLPLLNVLDFGEISVSLYPNAMGVPPSEPIVNFMQKKLGLRFLYNAYLKSGYYFLIVWFIFIQVFVRNKAMPFYLRFHSSQAILISMLLGVPQQVFFAVLNPWESGLVVQTVMYHSMVSIFLFVLLLVAWCCANALLKRTMKMPLVSEAAVMWAGKEGQP